MRKKIIAGNWKMNNISSEIKEFFNAIGTKLTDLNDREVIVAPAFPYLSAAKNLAEGKNITISAQNCWSEEKGAFTGEVGVEMLKDLGINTVILGHSERRHIIGETLQQLRAKVTLLQKHGIRIIFCVGETLPERESGNLYKVVEEQITSAFDNNLTDEIKDIVIAYEPVWAIGTGKVATGEQAQDMHYFIRELMKKRYNRENTQILYGGSVKPDNIKELISMPDIDGALVGGASLKADSFLKLVFYEKN